VRTILPPIAPWQVAAFNLTLGVHASVVSKGWILGARGASAVTRYGLHFLGSTYYNNQNGRYSRGEETWTHGCKKLSTNCRSVLPARRNSSLKVFRPTSISSP